MGVHSVDHKVVEQIILDLLHWKGWTRFFPCTSRIIFTLATPLRKSVENYYPQSFHGTNRRIRATLNSEAVAARAMAKKWNTAETEDTGLKGEVNHVSQKSASQPSRTNLVPNASPVDKHGHAEASRHRLDQCFCPQFCHGRHRKDEISMTSSRSVNRTSQPLTPSPTPTRLMPVAKAPRCKQGGLKGLSPVNYHFCDALDCQNYPLVNKPLKLGIRVAKIVSL